MKKKFNHPPTTLESRSSGLESVETTKQAKTRNFILLKQKSAIECAQLMINEAFYIEEVARYNANLMRILMIKI